MQTLFQNNRFSNLIPNQNPITSQTKIKLIHKIISGQNILYEKAKKFDIKNKLFKSGCINKCKIFEIKKKKYWIIIKTLN